MSLGCITVSYDGYLQRLTLGLSYIQPDCAEYHAALYPREGEDLYAAAARLCEHVREKMMSRPERWNPRYVCYARAHGRTPDEMLDHDRERFPGGCMVGYMEWFAERRREWLAMEHPDDYIFLVFGNRHMTEKGIAAFDRWLEERSRG